MEKTAFGEMRANYWKSYTF